MYNTFMNALARDILSYIQSDAPDDEIFNELSLRLFARQFEHNEPYRRLCESVGVVPGDIRRWQQVPAAPAQAFKRCELSCVPIDLARAAFHSSGTTGADTSRHFMDEDGLALYEASLRRGFDLALPKDRPHEIWALMPSPNASPNSSLSHMLGALGAARYLWDDNDAAAAALSARAEPLLLFGTAFAFVGLFDAVAAQWRLPAGSVVIETGGFKGRTREVSREDLYAMLSSRFHVPLDRCYSEYGMSEMASQFYGRGLDPVKRGPFWVRTLLVDPETGGEAAAGAAGLLAHFDLANFNSVGAIQTEDLGIAAVDGFALLGRATDAELRGCSLTAEELWTRQ